MSKAGRGLRALREISLRMLDTCGIDIRERFPSLWQNIEHDLMALDIVREKVMPLMEFTLVSAPGEESHFTIGSNLASDIYITKDEYRLLWEVMADD